MIYYSATKDGGDVDMCFHWKDRSTTAFEDRFIAMLRNCEIEPIKDKIGDVAIYYCNHVSRALTERRFNALTEDKRLGFNSFNEAIRDLLFDCFKQFNLSLG